MCNLNFNADLIAAFYDKDLYKIEEFLKRDMLQKEKDYVFRSDNFLEVYCNDKESWIYLIGKSCSNNNNNNIIEYIDLYLKPLDSHFAEDVLCCKIKRIEQKILLTENDLYCLFSSIKKSFDKGYLFKEKEIEHFYYNDEYFILDLDKIYININKYENINIKPSEILYNRSMYFYNETNDDTLFRSQVVEVISNKNKNEKMLQEPGQSINFSKRLSQGLRVRI